MSSKKYVWNNEIERLKQLERDGYNLSQIAEIYGVTRQCIHQVWIKNDLQREGAKIKRDKYREYRRKKWGDKEDILWWEKRHRFNTKRANAKRGKIEFTILFGDIIFPTHCPILGNELNYYAITKEEYSPSFDRLDPTKGYIPGNVFICSWRANRIKNDGNEEEHRKIADYLSNIEKEHKGGLD